MKACLTSCHALHISSQLESATTCQSNTMLTSVCSSFKPALFLWTLQPPSAACPTYCRIPHAVKTSLYSASYVSCKCETAHICCWVQCWGPFCNANAGVRRRFWCQTRLHPLQYRTLPDGTQQQTRHMAPWLQSNNGTDRLTDAGPFHRPCSAYCVSDVHVATTSITVDVSITSRPSVHHYYKRYCRLLNIEGVGMRGGGCPGADVLLWLEAVSRRRMHHLTRD